jgi:O-antigen/teichoic acid export membrane protein
VPRRRVASPGGADEGVAEFEPPSIASGGLEALLFRATELISVVAMVVLTARLLGPSGRGLYALASLSIGLCQIPFSSVWVANAVELARKRATPRELFGVSIVVAAGGGTVTCLVALAISPLLGDRWWVLALPSLVTPFVLLRSYQEGLWTALGHVRAVNLLRLGRATLPFLFIAPPLIAGATARTSIVIWELAFVALAVTAYFPLRAFLGGPRLPRDRGLYRRVVTYGLTLFGFRVVQLLNERVGLIALAAFSTNAAVGVFSIAIAATDVLLLSTEALALSTFRRIGSEERDASAALTVRTIRHCILLAGAASALVTPLAYLALPWVLGPGYDEVPLLLVLLLPNVLCVAAITPLYTFFQVQTEKPVTMFRVTGSALIAGAALNVALVPQWGAKGAAVAASLGGMVAAVVAFRAFAVGAQTRLRELRPGRQELRDYVALVASVTGRRAR